MSLHHFLFAARPWFAGFCTRPGDICLMIACMVSAGALVAVLVGIVW